MASQFLFRPIRSDDGPALAALIAASPSAGLVSFTYDYRADALETSRAFATDLHGIVAESDSNVIGMVFGDRVQVQLGGKVCEASYISNMCVHPDYRRRGVARGLSHYGKRYLDDLAGPDSVLYAAILEGNISTALTKPYQFQSTMPIQGGIVPLRRSPPGAKPGLTVDVVTDDALDEISAGMNRFYRGHNLWEPSTPDSLKSFLGKEVDGIRPNQLYVIRRGESIVAGLSLSDRTRLVRMKLANTSFFIRKLGAILGVLPRSGVLNALTIRRVWFRDGELDAARYLWQYLRYHLRHRGDSLGITYDPRDKLADVFQIPFWLPMFRASYAVRASHSLDVDRLTYCMAGP